MFCVSEPTFDPSIANCDFENGLCLYYQERAESKVWSRVSVKPNAYRIGDHTTGTGESQFLKTTVKSSTMTSNPGRAETVIVRGGTVHSADYSHQPLSKFLSKIEIQIKTSNKII